VGGGHKKRAPDVGDDTQRPGPRGGLEVHASLDRGSAAIAVGILRLDLDQVATTCTLFFYIGDLDEVIEILGIYVGHIVPDPVSEIIVIVVHSNSWRACASALPSP
jgi:hypothetical protein